MGIKRVDKESAGFRPSARLTKGRRGGSVQKGGQSAITSQVAVFESFGESNWREERYEKKR